MLKAAQWMLFHGKSFLIDWSQAYSDMSVVVSVQLGFQPSLNCLSLLSQSLNMFEE